MSVAGEMNTLSGAGRRRCFDSRVTHSLATAPLGEWQGEEGQGHSPEKLWKGLRGLVRKGATKGRNSGLHTIS